MKLSLVNSLSSRPEQFPFIATDKRIVAFRWSVKYFLLQIPRYSQKNVAEKHNKTEKNNCKALCFSSKRNNTYPPQKILKI